MPFIFVPRHRRRHIERLITAFQGAGATEPGMAKTLAEIGLADDALVQRLAEDGLIRSTSPGRWYLDGDALGDYRADQRRRALLGISFAAAMLLILTLVQWLARR